MGTTTSAPEDYPERLQITCGGRPDACGIYDNMGAYDEVIIEKGAADKVGLGFLRSGLVQNVVEGGLADKAGMKKHEGSRILNVEEVLQQMNTTALQLKIRAPSTLHNGTPVWKKDDFRLYSTKEGKFMLTDNREGVEKNTGYAMSSVHAGASPATLSSWMVYSRAKGLWCVDDTIAVWECKKPEFTVQQLVEYKPSVSSTEEDYRPGIIAVARMPEEITATDPFQYEIVPAAGDSVKPFKIHACCIRAYAPYRSPSQTLLTKKSSTTAAMAQLELSIGSARSSAPSTPAQPAQLPVRRPTDPQTRLGDPLSNSTACEKTSETQKPALQEDTGKGGDEGVPPNNSASAGAEGASGEDEPRGTDGRAAEGDSVSTEPQQGEPAAGAEEGKREATAAETDGADCSRAPSGPEEAAAEDAATEDVHVAKPEATHRPEAKEEMGKEEGEDSVPKEEEIEESGTGRDEVAEEERATESPKGNATQQSGPKVEESTEGAPNVDQKPETVAEEVNVDEE
ncbi:hypothetical protein DIPPA_31121 [Diplonema papillatum]|nr:hypothetical protein DIPPA_31121 [Diplonema papillatum]